LEDKKATESSSGTSDTSEDSSSSSSEDEVLKEKKKGMKKPRFRYIHQRGTSPHTQDLFFVLRVLYLQSDLRNLPQVGDKLPREMIHNGYSIMGIRRISMAIEYARHSIVLK